MIDIELAFENVQNGSYIVEDVWASEEAGIQTQLIIITAAMVHDPKRRCRRILQYGMVGNIINVSGGGLWICNFFGKTSLQLFVNYLVVGS